ncbi:uncharacterized protein LOC107826147 [Nicotiana tabacum]|uniref:Uncharacterized protein LOC107826147 n=2 Tax=Nicotiana TaxID=4085 RepID=A0A1S4D580_TOBAC|nr:PREDICTED: uncharacterized protein LOC104223896 [Nicotiana sylvestris]XP_016508585.1 PREDICTED: uncharacterized protein LOC107826147 [Nicotiana tabacum]
MAGPSHPKTLPTSSSTTTPSSSTLNSMKLKTLVQSFIFSHLYRVFRALAKAKSILFQLVKNVQLVHLLEFPMMKKNRKYKNNKLFLGSFRLHYNWCSSHVMPVPVPTALEDCATGHVYYDSTWNSIISTACDESELSGYLQWLEEKACEENNEKNTKNGNDIDKLADMFIANCHERFRLEKVESYRRFQEMLARSV